MAKDQVVDLLNTQLVEHAQNMRRIYRLSDVRRMALSQAARATEGKPPCTQPLIVTPGAGVTQYDSRRHGKLTVIAGHLRLRGNRYLGPQAPRLNCVLRFYAREADMLADMSTENGIRADPGPVSWALHFKTQLDADVPMHELVRASGKSAQTIRSVLRLLELGIEAQTLIDDGQLSISAAEYLLRIGDARLQARTARKFVKQRTKLDQMKLVVDHVVHPAVPSPYASKTSYGSKKVPTRLEKEELRRLDETPAEPALIGLPTMLGASLADLRAAAAATCTACPVAAEHGQKEPAWHLARTAAGKVCTGCNMRLVKGACNACPLPMMLSRVVREMGARVPA